VSIRHHIHSYTSSILLVAAPTMISHDRIVAVLALFMYTHTIYSLVLPAVELSAAASIPSQLFTRASLIEGSVLLTSLEQNHVQAPFSTAGLQFKPDIVVRVVHANTVKLENTGLVSLASVRTPTASGNFQFPECLDRAPASKLRQLLSPKTKVQIKAVAPNQVLVLRSDNEVLINQELVRTGFARVRGKNTAEDILPSTHLKALEEQAKIKGIGFQTM